MNADEQKVADEILARIDSDVARGNVAALATLAETYQRLMAGARNRAEAQYWEALLIQPLPVAPEPHCPPNYPWYPWWQNPVTCEAKTSTGTKAEGGS